jgi:hypothetical protein
MQQQQEYLELKYVHDSWSSHTKFVIWSLVIAIVYLAIALTTATPVMIGTVWVRPNLPLASVPYYDPTMPLWHAEYNGPEFWLMLLELPIFLIPFVTLIIITTMPMMDIPMLVHDIVCAVIAIVWGIGMFIYNCVRIAQCRSWAVCTADEPVTLTPNTRFIIFYVGHIVLAIVAGLLIILGHRLRTSARNTRKGR